MQGVQSKKEDEASGSAVARQPITEDEIRAVLADKPMTVHDFGLKFKSRLRSKEDKEAFVATVRRIAQVATERRTGQVEKFVVLREMKPDA